MHIEAVELRLVAVPLRAPLVAAWGVEREREVVLVHVITDIGDGWGECAALSSPRYTSEYAMGSFAVLRDVLIPSVFEHQPHDALGLTELLASFAGHHCSRAGLELALWDAAGRAEQRSLAQLWAASTSAATAGVPWSGTVPAGATVGIAASIGSCIEKVRALLDAGYTRVKMKVAPQWNLAPLIAVRDAFSSLTLVADANGSFDAERDAPVLTAIDQLGLSALEQPLPPARLDHLAALAARLRTPVALDESIDDVDRARAALSLGACSVVVVKPGPIGGYASSIALLDELAGEDGFDRAEGQPARPGAYIGGMYETSIGRAALAALAAHPAFTLAGDLTPAGTVLAVELAEPLVMTDGCIEVPNGPGIGVAIDHDAICAHTRFHEWVRP